MLAMLCLAAFSTASMVSMPTAGLYTYRAGQLAISCTGTRYTTSGPTVSGGTTAESNQAGVTTTLTLNGTQMSWIGYRCSCAAGIADVSIDGGGPAEVDMHSAVTQPQTGVYTSPTPPAGTHTLSITVTGEYDQAGDTANVVVDAFDVTD